MPGPGTCGTALHFRASGLILMPAFVSGRRYGCGRGDGRETQSGHEGDQVLQGKREPVQARHDQGVARAEVVQARGELGTAGGFARQLAAKIRRQPASVRSRVCRSRFCPDVDTRAYPISAPVRSASSGASRSSSSVPAMPAGVSVTLRPYGKRQCRSCWARRLSNTFFRQSPPAGNHDRGLSGGCLRIVRFTTHRARPGGNQAGSPPAYAQPARRY